MADRWEPRRIAVLGATGLTGSGIVQQLAQCDFCDEVVMFDLKADLLTAHAIDIREAQIVTKSTGATVTVGDLDRVADIAPVDLVVVAASLPEVPDGSRDVFLQGNIGVLRALSPAITHLAGSDGLVMIVTNPADVLATCLPALIDIAPARVFGYCLNDTVRFTAAIARELGVNPSEVDALVAGEHGDGQVPLYSRILVSGQPARLSDDQRRRIDEDVRGWFRRWSDLRPGRSSGWTTPVGSLATIRALAAGTPVPVAVWAESIPDFHPAHVTLNAIVQDGTVVPLPLDYCTEQERDQIAEASRAIARKTDAAGSVPTA